MPQPHIGCSGWQYRHWRGDFYPAEIPSTRWFEYYAARFDTVEINNTFYRLPEMGTFARWAERAPERFLFAIEASRFLTHMKKLKDSDEPITRLFERMQPLGRHLGPVLYQLPPGWKLDRERLEQFLQSMRRRGFGRIVNIASIGGKMAVPHMAPYCASKFALVGLSDSVRAELDQYGIRVTTVCPGLMRTGSPLNADIKGKHELEYAWFAISDSLPAVTISAENAARKIIDACRHGDAELIITVPAKFATRLNHVAPGVMARAMAIANRVLPGPSGSEGDQPRRGRNSQSKWTESFATVLTERAAVANNEM